MVTDCVLELMSWDIVFMNSCLLFGSGLFVLICHIWIDLGVCVMLDIMFAFTFIWGFIFLVMQLLEFSGNMFVFNSVIVCSMVYMIVGLHGSHLMMGLAFLWVSLKDVSTSTAVSMNSVRFSFLYWHFVDTIWVVLLCIIYENYFSCMFDMV